MVWNESFEVCYKLVVLNIVFLILSVKSTLNKNCVVKITAYL